MFAVTPHALFAATDSVVVILAVGGVMLAGFVACGIGLWRLYGAGPRRNRAYKRARELLTQNNHSAARALIDEIKLLGVSTPQWQGRINNLEGECRRAAGETALADKKFEEALEHHLAAAKLLATNPADARQHVLESMLSEVRLRAAAAPDDRTVKLIQRILQLHPQHAEAWFWLGIAQLKLNRSDAALAAFRAASEAEGRTVEPALYLGMMLVRDGKPKDGLRFLAEANKIAPHSSLVNWQLGIGLVTSGGDSTLAVRALQKAIGPDALPKAARNSDRFWADVLPEGSYLGRLAGKSSFSCPILGNNYAGMVRQAKLALGEALFRLDRTVESVAVLQELLNESEPTVPILRALGIALSKLERFDEAYAQLRAAYEQDAAKSPMTACCLAWCATKAQPSKPEDRPANVRWAVRLLADLAIPVEPEAARLVAQVYADAGALDVAVPLDDRTRLCGTLLALNLAEPIAATAIDHLAAAAPQALRPQHAFLYAWIARQHGSRGRQDLDLLLTVLQHRALAQEHFEQRGWKLEEVERLFLERWAEQHTSFPEALGPDYPARCERSLLEQAKRQEEAGDVAAARVTIDLLRRLTPPTAATLDRTARLAYARGDVDEAVRILNDWIAQMPSEPTPRLRLAVIEQSRGDHAAAMARLLEALDLSPPSAASAVALVGARLAIRIGDLASALDLVDRCLGQSPSHAEGLWLRAALLLQLNRLDEVRDLAPQFERIDVVDPRFHYFAAVAFLLAGDVNAARTAARRVGNEAGWQNDGQHLLGLLYWRRGDHAGAAAQFEAVLQAPEHAAHDHARLTLGRIRWEQGDPLEALKLWSHISPAHRSAWGLNDVIPGAAFFAGVQALRAGKAAQAVEWIGRAGDWGWRDPNLPALQERAVVEATRQALAEGNGGAAATLTSLLDRAGKSRGPNQAAAALLLSRLHRRADRIPEAREALRRVAPPSAAVFQELAATALADRQLTQAEELYQRVRQLEPNNHTAATNLLWTRLSLGDLPGAVELFPDLIAASSETGDKRLLTQLHTLLLGGSTLNIAFGDMSVDEERRLIEALVNVGKLDATVPLLCQLAAARPHSRDAKEAQTLGMVRLGKQRFDRGDWLGAEKWLSPLAKARPSAAVRNLLGINACLTQDFAGGILHLQEALRLAGDDPRIHQNLALAFTLQGDAAEAALCWGRYLGMMDKRLPRPPGFIDYHHHLRFHVLRYLGHREYDRERWAEALAYLFEAHKLNPELADLAERVFLLQVQLGQRADARNTLNLLHQLKPKHSPYQLYELDLVEVRAGADLETLLDALTRVVEQMIDDATVQDKAVQRVLPTLQYRSDYLTRVMREVREDLRRLYEDSPGWYDALRDLRGVKRDFRRLRQVVRYCAAMQVSESTRRRLDTLTDELDRKIEYCRRWEEDDS